MMRVEHKLTHLLQNFLRAYESEWRTAGAVEHNHIGKPFRKHFNTLLQIGGDMIEDVAQAVSVHYATDLINFTPLADAILATGLVSPKTEQMMLPDAILATGLVSPKTEQMMLPDALLRWQLIDAINEMCGFELFEVHIVNYIKVWGPHEQQKYVAVKTATSQDPHKTQIFERNNISWQAPQAFYSPLHKYAVLCQFLCHNHEVQEKSICLRHRIWIEDNEMVFRDSRRD